jgi:hypothetical protein
MQEESIEYVASTIQSLMQPPAAHAQQAQQQQQQQQQAQQGQAEEEVEDDQALAPAPADVKVPSRLFLIATYVIGKVRLQLGLAMARRCRLEDPNLSRNVWE